MWISFCILDTSPGVFRATIPQTRSDRLKSVNVMPAAQDGLLSGDKIQSMIGLGAAPFALTPLLCFWGAIAIWVLPAVAQSQPGRILSTTTLDVFECNVDGSNCFTVAGHFDNT